MMMTCKQNKENAGRTENSSDDDLSNILDEFNIIYDDDLVNFITNETSWVIDIGVTIHVTSRKALFSTYTLGNFGVVKMESSKLSKIIRKAYVILIIKNDIRLIL